jgi:hypothetical protein
MEPTSFYLLRPPFSILYLSLVTRGVPISDSRPSMFSHGQSHSSQVAGRRSRLASGSIGRALAAAQFEKE